jgi:NAD(P)-dependent dehydrogenase (short-subunit alcohol dehydrogenase family)
MEERREMSAEFQIDSSHLLLIGAGPGVGAAVVRRFGREGFRSTSVEHLRTAYDVDVLGGVVAAQVAAPVMRGAGSGTILFTGGGFADYPVPALASLSLGKAALRSAATLIADEVASDDVHAASITIIGQVAPGTAFDPNNIAELFWTAHISGKDTWQTEYRFEGAETHAATNAGAA